MAAKNKPTPIFVWEGADRNGNRKKGEVQASNMALAKAQLRREGINVLKIKLKPKPLFGMGGPRKKAITPLGYCYFFPPDGYYDEIRRPSGTGF